ncbi:lytic transglycosylase [Enterobacteriaceae bacterium H11S18]|nr:MULTISPECIES: lytic transglycosylase [Enterobacteriaceae]MCT4707336.1 lytic transglycosylase [Dryocola clanedunensis]MCT4709018.1 lytic transglycosylase [Dryocola clanedunensis]
MPGGEDYILRPAEVFSLSWQDLKSGAVDLYDIALMNDYLEMQADNKARILRWREANE